MLVLLDIVYEVTSQTTDLLISDSNLHEGNAIVALGIVSGSHNARPSDPVWSVS